MSKTKKPIIPAERSKLRLLQDMKKLGPLKYFTELMIKEPSHAWLDLLFHRVLVLNDATAVEYVMSKNAKNYQKGYFNKVLHHFLGNSVFLTEGETWKRLRRHSAPSFSHGNLKIMFEQMHAAVEAMCRRWDKLCEEEKPVNIALEMMTLALDIVLRSLLHEEKPSIAERLQRDVGSLLEEAEKRIWAPVSIPQWLALQRPKYRKAKAFIRQVVDELVQARRDNKAYPEDMLSRLISIYDVSDSERLYLQDQLLAILLAGHETTAHALTWSMFELGRHPEQAKWLREEVDSVLQQNQPTWNDIDKLQYAFQVFSEALRLYPPVWTLSREALEDDVIPLENGSSVELPKNSTAMLCCYALQRSEKYWKHPDAFDPSRFSKENSIGRPEFAAFPFGGGPRICLGRRFAEIESVLALSMIAQRYNFSLLPGQKPVPVPVITLRPDTPIWMRISMRAASSASAVSNARKTMDSFNDVDLALAERAAAAGCPFHQSQHTAA